MKKVTILTLITYLFAGPVIAQSLSSSVVSSSGDYYSTVSNSLSLTIGEPFTEFYSGGNHSLSTGFQQSIDAMIRQLLVSVFLEGPYSSNSMRTTLNENMLIPLNQPYNIAPWDYSGTEIVAVVPADVVDWLLVDLREAATPEEALPETSIPGWPKACFLKSNGSIVGLDGTSLPNIGNPNITGNLYVIVRHHNHIAVMSATGLALVSNIYSYDFTTGLDQAFGSGAGFKEIGTGIFGMVAGDSDADGDIGVNDYTKWAIDFGNNPVYLSSDNDLDSDIGVNDYTKWAVNFGLNNPISSTTKISFRSQVPDRKP